MKGGPYEETSQQRGVHKNGGPYEEISPQREVHMKKVIFFPSQVILSGLVPIGLNLFSYQSLHHQSLSIM